MQEGGGEADLIRRALLQLHIAPHELLALSRAERALIYACLTA